MKKSNGVTLASLVVYIIVMTIVITIMSAIISNFYKNTTTVQGSIEEIIEFNKFNNYFLKEVKAYNNSVDSIAENYILFSSGNSFSISNNIIYYNKVQICKGVQNMDISYGKVINEEGIQVDEETVIIVTLNFETFSQTINYKVENIY